MHKQSLACNVLQNSTLSITALKKAKILPRFFRAMGLATVGVVLSFSAPKLLSVQATTLDFSGEVDSGSLFGISYFGSFTFDESEVTSTDFQVIDVSALDLTFSSSETFDQTSDPFGPSLDFFDGALLGLNYVVENTTINGTEINSFAFVAPFDFGEPTSFIYEPTSGAAGGGDVDIEPIPEPMTLLGSLLAIGWGAAISRKRNRRKTHAART